MTGRILIDGKLVSLCPESPVRMWGWCGHQRVLVLWVEASPEGTLGLSKQQNEARGPQLLVRSNLLFPLNLEVLKLGRKTVGSPED